MLLVGTYESRKAWAQSYTNLWGFKRWKYEDILSITDNFSQDNFIANFVSGIEFHYGKVYRGSDGVKTYAVKIWDEDVEEGIGILMDELLLSHSGPYKGSAKPFAFCCFYYEDTDLPSAIVYDLDPLDSLSNLIPKDTFSWSDRMKVALGIAVAIRAYHPDCTLRNVDADNFLCDKNYIPRLYDFGSASGGVFHDRCYSDKMRGGRGYADPHAVSTGKYSEKIDVFAYGLVLLSLITRKLINAATETDWEFVKLAEGEYRSRKGAGRKRPSLVNESFESAPYFDYDDASVVTKLAMTCIRYKPDERPDMEQVVTELGRLKIMSKYGEEIGVNEMLAKL